VSERGHDRVIDALRTRRSIREFADIPVPRELTERLLDAAAWAPSAGNRQDWHFSIVESPDVKAAMGGAVRCKWKEIIAGNQDLGCVQELADYAASFADFDRAPVVIVVSAARPNSVQRKLLGEYAGPTAGSFASAAMAAENLMVAAHALGLGTCCMTGALAASEDLCQILGLSGRREVVCLVALGYPRCHPSAPARKPRSEIVRYF
jgi:coenzyme F420-0:L-glutamate ligase/coenzyme F420-1:gamma-L-glutamate ligase